MAPKITTTKHYIIFDIDSTSVGGGLFRFGYDTKNTCLEKTELFSLRKNITNGTEYPFQRFFEKTLQTLENVAREIHLQALIPLDGIYCNVGTPWMSAQKRIVEYGNKKIFTLSQELIDELIDKEINTSFQKNIDYKNHNVEVIDRQTLDIYANGYRVRKPIGKEVANVNIHSLISVMSKVTKDAFSDVIEKVFHRETTYLSNTFVSYNNVRNQLPNSDNALIVDVSGEVTDVVVVRNDHIDHLGSIPVGIYGIVRHIRDDLKIPYEKARRIIELHHQEKLDIDYSNNIHSNIHAGFRVWFKKFFDLCDVYAKQGLLPSTIILRGDSRALSWFEYMILQEDHLREHMHTVGKIDVQYLDQQTVQRAYDKELDVIAEFIT